MEDNPNNPNNPNIYDYIVIGAGFAGLAYSYTNQTASFLILDQNDYIGGRVHNIKWHDDQISLGGGVILHDNTHTLELCKKFGFELGSFTSVYDYPDLPPNKDSSKPNGPNFYPNNEIIFKYLKQKYAKNKKNIKQLGMSFRDFLYYYLPFQAVKYILDNALYYTSLDGDVDYLLTNEFSYDILRVEDEKLLYIKDGGYNKLLDKLVKSIGKTKIKLNSKVKQVDFLSDKQHYKVTLSNNQSYLAKKLVVTACAKSDIIYNVQPGLSALIKQIYSSIGSVPYIRIYSYHSKGHGLANAIRLDGLSGKTMIMNKNILMLCYTESVNATNLYSAIKDLEIKDQNDFLYRLFQNHNINITKPDDIYIVMWDVGMHYPKPNCADLTEILNKMSEYNFKMIGEAVAKKHGWVDSALSTIY
jgi:hypothetical protein